MLEEADFVHCTKLGRKMSDGSGHVEPSLYKPAVADRADALEHANLTAVAEGPALGMRWG